MADRPTPPSAAAATLRTLRKVRSTRDFGAEPIPDAAIAEILEVARWTGSSRNRQAWTFVLIRDRATLAAIAAASPNAGHVGRAAAAIAIVMGGPDLPGGDQPTWDAYDEGRAAERILVAATALGLASAVGWILGAARPAVRSLLGVPDDRTLRTIVSLGYPTEAAAAPRSAPGTARKPLAEIVRRERFA